MGDRVELEYLGKDLDMESKDCTLLQRRERGRREETEVSSTSSASSSLRHLHADEKLAVLTEADI